MRNKIYTVGFSAAFALAALVATLGDAYAQKKWCGYSGTTTECTYTSEAQCRASHRDCLPAP